MFWRAIWFSRVAWLVALLVLSLRMVYVEARIAWATRSQDRSARQAEEIVKQAIIEAQK